MRASKTLLRRPARKVAQVKERRAGYAAPTADKKAVRASETRMDFHVVLPRGTDVDGFTDQLIELVEAYRGMIGGGTAMLALILIALLVLF
jgi:hypothetical protein